MAKREAPPPWVNRVYADEPVSFACAFLLVGEEQH